MLARALRRTGQRANAAPAQIDPNAYAAATSEKLPAPSPSVERTSSGTPTIHVPDESVTASPSTTTDAASTGSGRSAAKPSEILGRSCVRPADPPLRPYAEQEDGRQEERRRVESEERADRHHDEQEPGERPAADRERIRRRPHQPVRLLHVAPVDELGQKPAVRRVEVARRRREHESGHDEDGERQMTRQPGDRHRDEHDPANEVGGDHHAPPIPAVGDDSAVQPEEERGHAVGEPNRDHAERPARDEREPHERDVLERVAELADRDRRVRPPKVAAPEERGRPLGPSRLSREQLFRSRGRRLGHARVLPVGERARLASPWLG